MKGKHQKPTGRYSIVDMVYLLKAAEKMNITLGKKVSNRLPEDFVMH